MSKLDDKIYFKDKYLWTNIAVSKHIKKVQSVGGGRFIEFKSNDKLLHSIKNYFEWRFMIQNSFYYVSVSKLLWDMCEI